MRAVTSGTLWALKREDFRGILMSEFSNLSSLKLLRSVDLLSRLTILQLSHVADSLSEVSFSNGQAIVNRVDVSPSNIIFPFLCIIFGNVFFLFTFLFLIFLLHICRMKAFLHCTLSRRAKLGLLLMWIC